MSSACDPPIPDFLKLAAINAFAAYTNCLTGNQPPAIRDRYKRMIAPEVGDVVLEVTTCRRWLLDVYSRNEQCPAIGILLRKLQEPVVTAEKLAEMHAEGDYYTSLDETVDQIPKEEVWYLRPLDDSVPEYRWVNACFIRVYTSLEQLRI